MTVEIGTAIGQEVGSNVELVSIGGTDSHRAQLSAGLKAAGVDVNNAPSGNIANFAMANAAGYGTPKTDVSQPAMGQRFEKTLG